MTDYLSYLNLFYGIVLFIFAIFSLAGIYHLLRFGFPGDLSKFIIFLYMTISLVIIGGSIFLLNLGPIGGK